MRMFSTCTVSNRVSSETAGDEVGAALSRAAEAGPLKLALVYGSVNHDQEVCLRRIKALLPNIPLVGCSTQGVMARGAVIEHSRFLAAAGLGGDELQVAVASAREIQLDTHSKGVALAEELQAKVSELKLALIFYDPLSGVDVDCLLDGIRTQLDCPVVGGGAGAPWGEMSTTSQYLDTEVVEHAAILVGLGGPFEHHLGVCHGTSPTGITMQLTKTEGNTLVEIDGRPAVDTWKELTGGQDSNLTSHEFSSYWAVGVERKWMDSGEEKSSYLIRAPFGADIERGTISVLAAIEQDTMIMFHHRTVPAVLDGTTEMAESMAQRLAGKSPWLVLGFECGARTRPFLGDDETLAENIRLQETVAPDSPWLGMLAWGEVAPVADLPGVHNYTFPLIAFTE